MHAHESLNYLAAPRLHWQKFLRKHNTLLESLFNIVSGMQNLVAHKLVKHSYETKSFIFVGRSPLSFLLPSLVHDVTLMAS